jgi:hypothetical protein
MGARVALRDLIAPHVQATPPLAENIAPRANA